MRSLHFQRSRRKVISAIAIAVVLSGCAALIPAPQTWRVAANYRVTHAGTGTELGYKALAHQYQAERRWREARDAWRKAALASPEDIDILNALGLAEASQGQYDEAVASLRRAVALAPQRAQLLNNLGYALLLAGQNIEAKSVLKEALAQSPAHPLARANLDRIDKLASSVNPRGVESDLPLPLGQPSLAAGDLQTSPNVEPLELRQTGLADATGKKMALAAVPSSLAPDARGAVLAGKLPPPRIEIANGNGVTGMAVWLGGWLRMRGLVQNPRVSNALPFNTATTVVRYKAGYFTAAQEISKLMPQRVELAAEQDDALNADIKIVLGKDLGRWPPLACTVFPMNALYLPLASQAHF